MSLDKHGWVNNFDFFIRNVKLIHELNEAQNFDVKAYFVNGTLSGAQVEILDELAITSVVLDLDLVTLIESVSHPSQQHGLILNLLSKKYCFLYDYLILLDPDYYIVQANWIEFCLDQMRNKLDLLGSGYPYWMSNYRNDYPTAYFMIIKSGRINKFLDFLPDTASFDFRNDDFRNQLKEKFQHTFIDTLISGYILRKYPNLLSIYSLPSTIRFFINARLFFYRRSKKSYIRDTGYKVIQVINRGKFKSYTLPSAAPLRFDEEVSFGVQPSYYLYSNPDVRIAKMDPRIHFWKYGIRENRKFQILDRNMEVNSNFYKIISKFLSYPLRHPTIIFWDKATDDMFNELLTEDEKHRISFWYFNESIFSFHLGNSVATDWSSDLSKIDSLIKKLNPNLKLEDYGKA